MTKPIADANVRNRTTSVAARKRGRPSNRRHSDAHREQISAIICEHYHDFGPTLALEYLIERHEKTVACETLRQLMISAGLWKNRDARRPRPYQPRYRRDCRGELIQVDGSKHWWMEDRGPQCTLLVYIDDATSELMQLTTGFMTASGHGATHSAQAARAQRDLSRSCRLHLHARQECDS